MDKESAEIRVLLNQVLIQNRESDRLKETLGQLLNESGWKDDVTILCRKVIQERGLDNLSVDDIVKEVTPEARAKVPAEVKQLLLDRIRSALLKEIEEREKENGNK